MRIDISLLAVAMVAAGCSTARQNSAAIYPPAELVQVAPGGDGERVDVGLVVSPGWFAETVNPVPAEHNAATVAYAVPRVVGATAAAAWNNKLATLGIVVGSAVVYKSAQGELDDLAFWDSDEKHKGASGTFEISDKGATSGTFDDLTGSATIIVDKTEPTPEGPRQTRVQIVIDQDDKD